MQWNQHCFGEDYRVINEAKIISTKSDDKNKAKQIKYTDISCGCKSLFNQKRI